MLQRPPWPQPPPAWHPLLQASNSEGSEHLPLSHACAVRAAPTSPARAAVPAPPCLGAHQERGSGMRGPEEEALRCRRLRRLRLLAVQTSGQLAAPAWQTSPPALTALAAPPPASAAAVAAFAALALAPALASALALAAAALAPLPASRAAATSPFGAASSLETVRLPDQRTYDTTHLSQPDFATSRWLCEPCLPVSICVTLAMRKHFLLV